MTKQPFKYFIYALILIIVMALSNIIVFSIKNNKNSQTLSEYYTTKVVRGDIKDIVKGSSKVIAAERKDIKSNDSSIVDKVLVSEGQLVSKGDMILTLDRDTKFFAVENAKINLSLEEKKLEMLEHDKKNLKVYSPSSGVIGIISVQLGEHLEKGSILTTITDKSKLELTASYNTAQIKNIKVGEEAQVFLLDYFKTVKGIITKINETGYGIPSGGILHDVIIEIDNPGALIPGKSAQVSIMSDQGNLQATKTSELRWRETKKVELYVDSILKNIYISPGDYVEKGELIAELQNPELESKIALQKIKVKQKKLELDEKLKQLEKSVIYAPISGKVININVTEGSIVSSNTTIASIVNVSSLEMIMSINEIDIGRIEIGQQAVLKTEAIPNATFEAEVINIALEASPKDGVSTFDVKLKIKDTEILKPGMSVNVEIITKVKKDVLLLPIESVHERKGISYVKINEYQSDQNQSYMIPIEIGVISEDFLEVISGLKEGDSVIYSIID